MNNTELIFNYMLPRSDWYYNTIDHEVPMSYEDEYGVTEWTETETEDCSNWISGKGDLAEFSVSIEVDNDNDQIEIKITSEDETVTLDADSDCQIIKMLSEKLGVDIKEKISISWDSDENTCIGRIDGV